MSRAGRVFPRDYVQEVSVLCISCVSRAGRVFPREHVQEISVLGFNGAETNCRIAHVLGILMMLLICLLFHHAVCTQLCIWCVCRVLVVCSRENMCRRLVCYVDGAL